MRLDGRRFSSNVDDRRRSSIPGGMLGGIGGGIGTLIIIALITWLSGGNPLSVLEQSSVFTGEQAVSTLSSEQEEAYAQFASRILAGTEDVWNREFKKMGLEYREPKMVLFTGAVNSACGNATSSVGPFYCSGDQTVYIDLSFFDQMERQMGAGGDFACAYVIAHEVGHHVQYLLGILDEAHAQMNYLPQTEANKISVRLELQADYFAGVWAHHDNLLFNSLEDGDIEEGLNAASKIGDDYLQKTSQGYTVPETFNHGRSDQRMRWLQKGIKYGTIRDGDTFSPNYNSL